MSTQAIAQTLNHTLRHPTLVSKVVADSCEWVSTLGVGATRPQDIALAEQGVDFHVPTPSSSNPGY